jgi:formyl-CoA transferase
MGIGATYRLYKCSEGWVFLGLVLEKEWHQFCNIIESPELAIDRRFRTSDARAENRSALESLLENLFLTDTADNWELLLATAGLGCVRADGYAPGEFWLRDKHIQVNEYTKSVEHGEHGPYTRHGPVVRLRRTPNSLGPAPMAGEQTSSILQELGYKQKAVTQLRKAQIVWSEPAVDLS